MGTTREDIKKWLQDNYNEGDKEVIRQFFKNHVELLYSKNWHGLYRLKNHEVANSLFP